MLGLDSVFSHSCYVHSGLPEQYAMRGSQGPPWWILLHVQSLHSASSAQFAFSRAAGSASFVSVALFYECTSIIVQFRTRLC